MGLLQLLNHGSLSMIAFAFWGVFKKNPICFWSPQVKPRLFNYEHNCTEYFAEVGNTPKVLKMIELLFIEL